MPATIVDVLDNALDGELTADRVARMTLADVAELSDVVNAFYEAWQPPDRSPDLLRVHMGGWIARTANAGLPRDLLHAALLYVHEVIVYDPVAAYFEPNRDRLRKLPAVEGLGMQLAASTPHLEANSGYVHFAGDLEAHRSHLGLAVAQIGELAPLIRTGVAVPIPHLRLTLARQESIFAAVRHLLRDGEYHRLVDNPIDRPALAYDEGPQIHFRVDHPRRKQDALLQEYGDAAYYLARTLAMGDAAGAQYLPPSATEWAIYEQRLSALGQRLSQQQRVQLTVTPTLVASRLPFLRSVPTPTVLAARKDEDAFEHWRLRLQAATRQVISLPSEGADFVEEARAVMHEELDEAAADVRRVTSRSATLMRGARDASITVASGVGQALATGAAMPAAGVAAGGMLAWLVRTMFGPSLHGTRTVLAHLVQARPEGPEHHDDGWPAREGLTLRPK